MSSANGPDQPPTHPAGASPAPGPAIVRLPWWVNVTLVLTLLAAFQAASQATNASSAARDAQNQTTTQAQTGSPDSEVQAMCRLLGMLAVKQGIDLNTAFSESTPTTNCHMAAQDAATPSP